LKRTGKRQRAGIVVSQSLAQRMFPNQEAVNRHVYWTDPGDEFVDISTAPAPHCSVWWCGRGPMKTSCRPVDSVYQPFGAGFGGGRLFAYQERPYALVQPITKLIAICHRSTNREAATLARTSVPRS